MTQQQMTVEQAIELARAHQSAGRLAEAESIYTQVVAAFPNHPEALHLLGTMAYQTNRIDQAIELLTRSIRANPSNARAHAHLGQALVIAGRKDEAIEAYYRAAALDPRIAEVWNNLGTELSLRGQQDGAIAALKRGAALRPDLSHIAYNLGVAYRAKGFDPEAIRAFREAIRLKPDDYLAWDRLGDALFGLDRLDEAIAAHEKAIALNPNYADSHNNLGNALHAAGQFERAIQAYRRAEVLRPDWPLAHYNLSLTLLLQGDYENGWPQHEWRGRAPELGKMHRIFPQPRWDGGELKGRRILLHSEQGIGDTIHFIRYLPMVAQRVGRILLACQSSLLGLLRDFPNVEQLIGEDEPVPPFDEHCPLLSLPAIFKTELNNIPKPIPYLHADPQIAARWKRRLAEYGSLEKVGLVWAGKPEHGNDRRRSMNLAELAPLAQLSGIQFVSLQKGRGAKEAAHPPGGLQLFDAAEDLTDFAQTAGLIENLDLILTVDTAVAHLAGAMGKAVWVMLPFVPDWRWLLGRTDSPWYPTMRLFRQDRSGDWAAVVQSVLQSLREGR
jgi:tetratricopeptide (TPR) repeat protein